jgi:hypothetical protein
MKMSGQPQFLSALLKRKEHSGEGADPRTGVDVVEKRVTPATKGNKTASNCSQSLRYRASKKMLLGKQYVVTYYAHCM